MIREVVVTEDGVPTEAELEASIETAKANAERVAGVTLRALRRDVWIDAETGLYCAELRFAPRKNAARV